MILKTIDKYNCILSDEEITQIDLILTSYVLNAELPSVNEQRISKGKYVE